MYDKNSIEYLFPDFPEIKIKEREHMIDMHNMSIRDPNGKDLQADRSAIRMFRYIPTRAVM